MLNAEQEHQFERLFPSAAAWRLNTDLQNELQRLQNRCANDWERNRLRELQEWKRSQVAVSRG